MSKVLLYLHTLRYLQPRQVVARVWSRLYRPRVVAGAPGMRRMQGAFTEPVHGAPSLLGPHQFRFLNLERDCVSAADWHPHQAPKLWTYNLHYFDDLNATDSAARADWHANLLQRWAREIVPGSGEAWDPYPISRRIVNWIKWSLRGNSLSEPLRDSLAMQARWLERRVEHHLRGNHVFANAKALLYVGTYFVGAEAERWRQGGLALLERELVEQILPDGGHFELSPMYHATMLEDVLDILNLLQAYQGNIAASWRDAAMRMRRWLQAMVHPDGEIAFFNDAAFDIAPRLELLEGYALRLGLSAMPEAVEEGALLPDSGYARFCQGPAVLICDCGSVGPTYQPGHAHADTLSFELSLLARRVFVNSGTSMYEVGAERQRQRSTPAHNTVAVDGENSSEVWAGFRVARRARAKVFEMHLGQPSALDASHDGYRRLRGRNLHRRRWTLQRQALDIVDTISGPFESAQAYFHLHPDVCASLDAASSVKLTRQGQMLANMTFAGARRVRVEAGTWHPRFGESLANQCVVVEIDGGALSSRVEWPEAV